MSWLLIFFHGHQLLERSVPSQLAHGRKERLQHVTVGMSAADMTTRAQAGTWLGLLWPVSFFPDVEKVPIRLLPWLVGLGGLSASV